MAYEKIAKLVLKLSSLTGRGEIEWHATVESNLFQASFPGFTVEISKEAFKDEENYYVEIRNSEGESVDSVSDGDLYANFTNAFEIMRELYESARRQALGVEAALDELLRQLGEDE